MQILAGSACLSSQTVWHYNCSVLIFPLPRLSICFQFLHLLGWLRYPTGFCPRHPLLHLLCSQLWNTGTLKHFYKQDSITGLFCLPEILAAAKKESFHLYLLHASLAVKLVIIALHKSEFFDQFSGQECAVNVQCPGWEESTWKKDFAGEGFHIIPLPFLWLTLKITLGDEGKRPDFAFCYVDFKKQNLTQGQALGNKLESQG